MRFLSLKEPICNANMCGHVSHCFPLAEPCPPGNLAVNASCGDNGALVSWRPSPVATDYHVSARTAEGHVHMCNTSFSNCSLSDLHCGQQYTVSVTASHENCSSKASQNVNFNTGMPCPYPVKQNIIALICIYLSPRLKLIQYFVKNQSLFILCQFCSRTEQKITELLKPNPSKTIHLL